MSEPSPRTGGTAGEQYSPRWYIGVVVVEVLVLAAIWIVQRYFGG